VGGGCRSDAGGRRLGVPTTWQLADNGREEGAGVLRPRPFFGLRFLGHNALFASSRQNTLGADRYPPLAAMTFCTKPPGTSVDLVSAGKVRRSRLSEDARFFHKATCRSLTRS
jgi:hypothetical protein